MQTDGMKDGQLIGVMGAGFGGKKHVEKQEI